MARVAIIGGSGHVGTYLVPRLVEAGHEVINVTRGQRKPYSPNAAWGRVTTVTADRDAEEKAGTFGARIAALSAQVADWQERFAGKRFLLPAYKAQALLASRADYFEAAP